VSRASAATAPTTDRVAHTISVLVAALTRTLASLASKSSVHTASSTGPYADGAWVRRVRDAVEADRREEAVEAERSEVRGVEADRREEVVEAGEAAEAGEAGEADRREEVECSEQDRREQREEGRVRLACLIMTKTKTKARFRFPCVAFFLRPTRQVKPLFFFMFSSF
jgi:hypothetical protein